MTFERGTIAGAKRGTLRHFVRLRTVGGGAARSAERLLNLVRKRGAK